MRWCYREIEETIEDPILGRYETYGIEVRQRVKGIWEELELIHDVTTDRWRAGFFIELFNSSQLSPNHLRDVLEDMLP